MDNHNGSIDLLKMGIDGINVEYELICLEDDSFAELEEIDARLKELSEKIPELDKEIDRLTNRADGLDYFASVASGVVSALVDSFFVGSILGKTGWEDGWKKGWKEELAKTDNFFKKIVIWKANLKAKGFDSLSEEEQALLPGGGAGYLDKLGEIYDTSAGVSPSLLNNLPSYTNEAGDSVSLSDKVWETIKTNMTVEDIGGIEKWSLFGDIGIARVGYQGHVIPVILAVFFMCLLEKKLHKIVPEMIDLFVTPLVTVLVTAFAAFLIIGPVFAVVENWVLAGAKWLITVGYGIGAAAMGAIYPWTVVMGLHHMYNVIEAGMIAQTGVNTWMPIASAANFAQFGACLAVALKVHNQKTKSVALPSSLSASLGITEPAIFGINFRFMKPFICGMIGGAAGAWFAAVVGGSGFGATTYGVTGIPGIPAINNVPMYIIELLIASGIAFALTWFIWKEEKPAETHAPVPEAAPAPEVPTASVIRCAAGSVLQPVKGNVIAREAIPDETFASGVLGDGVGIEPTDELVVAPFDGTISSVAESQHAIGIEANGMEMLIHVGVDTVNMKGDGFTCMVKEGDEVKAGQPLIRFDREKIKAAGYSDTVAVLLTNSDDLEGVECGLQ